MSFTKSDVSGAFLYFLCGSKWKIYKAHKKNIKGQ